MSEERKSLYPPIEIKLDGEVYQSRKFTHSLLIEKTLHEKVIEESEPKKDESNSESKKDESDIDFSKRQWGAYCNWMRIVFGVKEEKLEETEFSEIEDAFMKVKTELLKRQGTRMEKHVVEIKSVTKRIENVASEATNIKLTAEEIEKNVKGSGKKT